MSYILDALRRADSERERGAVPSLHSKPVPPALADADDEGERSRIQPLHWAVGGLSLTLVGLLLWLFLGRDAAEPPAATVANPPPPVAGMMPSAQPMPPVPPPVPIPAEAPPVASPSTPPIPAPVQTAPPMQRKAQVAAAVPTQRAASKVRPAVSAAPEAPVQSISELPDDVRRELPQLQVGGAMYSQNAANRMLILNGQVFHEGDKVANNLVLEQIKLKSAVLSYRGYRYGINY